RRLPQDIVTMSSLVNVTPDVDQGRFSPGKGAVSGRSRGMQRGGFRRGRRGGGGGGGGGPHVVPARVARRAGGDEPGSSGHGPRGPVHCTASPPPESSVGRRLAGGGGGRYHYLMRSAAVLAAASTLSPVKSHHYVKSTAELRER